MDKEMNYEYLIRRAFNCDRYGVAGADADTYRALQRTETTYRTEMAKIAKGERRMWNKSEQEMLADYMFMAGKVSAYLDNAITYVREKKEDSMTEQQSQDFEDALSLLYRKDIESIEKCIILAEKVMLELGLFPG